MKLISKLFSSSLAIIAVFSMLNAVSVSALALSPSHAFAISGPANEACTGVGLVSGGGCGDNGTQVSNTLGTMINVFSAIIGFIAVIMIIVAGLQFMTANGNTQNITKARTSLMYAIIGLIIVVLAQALVHFVINQASTSG